MSFIKAGKQPRPQPRAAEGLLTTAQDWQLMVDLGRQLKFLINITVKSLRPDIIILSEATKQLALIEVTVPWEDCLEEPSERKLAKYQGLVEECQRQGWRSGCHPAEVGCGGLAGLSLFQTYT